MGVLMSRRQTVEQVQKVSLAVSAFKDGLRERPAAKRPAEGTASRRGTLEEDAVQELREEEEGAPGGPSRSWGGGTRSAAWARLRDGRGVEPEELDRPACFTPPALVRPVRPTREEERLEISLEQREQVTNEEMCEVCEVWTADSLLPCRVCTKVYHDGCLRRMGLLSPDEASEAIEAAHSTVGWSCYHCDNLNSLLTEEEMSSLSDAFRQTSISPENTLTLEDFLRYKGLAGQPSSEDEKERHSLQFAALDPGQKGHIAWEDFLSHESLLLLQRSRTQEGLLGLLTGKERERAREAFLTLDHHGEGRISQKESQRSHHTWFRKQHPGAPPSIARVSQVEPVSESSSQRQEDKEVTNEEMCEVCEVWTADSLLPCRVCTKVYHDGCLRRMGLLSPDEASEAIEAAHSTVGWSCYHCDNLNSLLTEEEMSSLSDAFRQTSISPENTLTLEDFLRYKGLAGQPSSEDEKERHSLQFAALDPGQKGHIAWEDFLSHESLLLLQRSRTQEGLLGLLTGKEREQAREAFLTLDQHGEGRISQKESQRSHHTWFRKQHPGAPPSIARTVTWPAFLRESTVYILAARPNSAAIHLKPLM
ncbi:PHD finger protein 24 [Protobothrops mucrosquamatus]|uniref:PHD finger protein 24 n=1 Tax=Protobothrops mucrosquamatus TaxID=103944 RepID=UPI000775F389|nr:PHD finger protein 24 [Protobothrops mucrosquamatus]